MLSYWERSSFLHYDYIVIGAGIVGLSTALSLRERLPKASILVLERGILPTGASTKNAGFACIGSLTEILEDLNTMPVEKVIELVSLRKKGLQKLRNRVGNDKIDYTENGSYELLMATEIEVLDSMNRVNELLRPILGCDAYHRADNKLSKFGFNQSIVKYLIENTCEGQLNSGKMMRTLLDLCMTNQIEVKTGAEVLSIKPDGNMASVVVRHTPLVTDISFICQKVAVCTNAFTRKLISDIDIKPGRGQVLITEPIPNLKFKGVFHFDRGYYYFREVDGRVLFGGGRNMEMQMEATDEFAYNEKILTDLRLKLATILLPFTPHKIDYSWTGIMAFGKDKFPIIRRHSEHTYIAARMGGMGLAIGSEAGDLLAKLILEEG